MKEADLKVGEVYEFKAGARRIVSFDTDGANEVHVNWEYADGVKRVGRIGGRNWISSFAAKAKPMDESGGSYVCCWIKTDEMACILRACKRVGRNVEGFIGESAQWRARKILETEL